jgi:hypothetical protein
MDIERGLYNNKQSEKLTRSFLPFPDVLDLQQAVNTKYTSTALAEIYLIYKSVDMIPDQDGKACKAHELESG